MIAVTPVIAAQIAELSYVQWIVPYHPLRKAAPPPRETWMQSVLVGIARIPGADAAVDRIRGSFRQVVISPRGDEFVVSGVASASEVERVPSEPVVIGVEEYEEPVVSAEISTLGLGEIGYLAVDRRARRCCGTPSAVVMPRPAPARTSPVCMP